MIDLVTLSSEVLGEAGFSTSRSQVDRREVLVFEDATVLGFLFAYADTFELLEGWEADADRAVSTYQFSLRRAAQKAWNAYSVFLARERAVHSHSAALAAIEEDLRGTRKVARAGVRDSVDVREALLSLLPLQAAPKLGAVDIQAEIRQRATELQPRAIDAFLSRSDDAAVLQVLEGEQ